MSRVPEFESLRRFWYRRVDERIDDKRACVASVVRTLPGQRLEGFGSGFFYQKAGWPFFITAKHVVDDVQSSIQQGQLSFLLVRGRKGLLKLAGVEFLVLGEFDLAVAPLWKLPSTNYAHVDFLTEVDVVSPTAKDFFAFTGFPASRNKTYIGRAPKLEQRVLTLTASSNAPSESFPFVFLPIIKKGMHNSNLEKITIDFPNGLEGMSGGPMFTVHGTLDVPALGLCGVGMAWHSESVLKALRMDIVDAWLENFLDW